MRPQVEIGRHFIRRESVPVQMRELKKFCEWEDIDLSEMPIFAGKATNVIKELIAEVERLRERDRDCSCWRCREAENLVDM
jgi:hypothetical protein